MDTASLLFYQKGFSGTSVRDIAEKASVNVSAISYYFRSKQGLLENVVTNYYEEYFKIVEENIHKLQTLQSLEKLKKLLEVIIHYKQQHHKMSCFIHRELTLDSVFVREITVTYLAKENHYLSKLFFDVVKEGNVPLIDRHFLFMQLKGMLITPYILHTELKAQVIGTYSNEEFAIKYVQTIHRWLDSIVDKKVINPV